MTHLSLLTSSWALLHQVFCVLEGVPKDLPNYFVDRPLVNLPDFRLSSPFPLFSPSVPPSLFPVFVPGLPMLCLASFFPLLFPLYLSCQGCSCARLLTLDLFSGLPLGHGTFAHLIALQEEKLPLRNVHCPLSGYPSLKIPGFTKEVVLGQHVTLRHLHPTFFSLPSPLHPLPTPHSLPRILWTDSCGKISHVFSIYMQTR